MHVCMYVCLYACLDACLYVCLSVCMYVSVCMSCLSATSLPGGHIACPLRRAADTVPTSLPSPCLILLCPAAPHRISTSTHCGHFPPGRLCVVCYFFARRALRTPTATHFGHAAAHVAFTVSDTFLSGGPSHAHFDALRPLGRQFAYAVPATSLPPSSHAHVPTLLPLCRPGPLSPCLLLLFPAAPSHANSDALRPRCRSARLRCACHFFAQRPPPHAHFDALRPLCRPGRLRPVCYLFTHGAACWPVCLLTWPICCSARLCPVCTHMC